MYCERKRLVHQENYRTSDTAAAFTSPAAERIWHTHDSQGQMERVLIDNLLVRIHLVIEMIWWTGLAPWEFEFPFPGNQPLLMSEIPLWEACLESVWWSRMQTFIIYKLGFDQNYYTFT